MWINNILIDSTVYAQHRMIIICCSVGMNLFYFLIIYHCSLLLSYSSHLFSLLILHPYFFTLKKISLLVSIDGAGFCSSSGEGGMSSTAGLAAGADRTLLSEEDFKRIMDAVISAFCAPDVPAASPSLR